MEKSLLKAVSLPKNDSNIIALIYEHSKDIDINTCDIVEETERFRLAYGEKTEDLEEYEFYFTDNVEDSLEIPLDGSVYMDDVIDTDSVKWVYEAHVIDYVTVENGSPVLTTRWGANLSGSEE